ncbi:transposase [Photorhabdus australis]|uniref:transposase n=1 Tax=Photorhabdus australis TaxID=286156 RepID=UPI00055C3240|nr:transposase [Photorhabdus australis]
MQNDLTPLSRELFQELLLELKEQQLRLKVLDKRLNHLNAQEEDIRRLLTLPGIGPLGASALMIALGESTDFKNGRHFASYP